MCFQIFIAKKIIFLIANSDYSDIALNEMFTDLKTVQWGDLCGEK